MRRQNVMALVVLVAVVAACGVTQQQRELQTAEAIATANRSSATALDFGIIKADEGEVIQGITRVATADLNRAIEMRRAGGDKMSWDRIMDIIMDGLKEAARILDGREK